MDQAITVEVPLHFTNEDNCIGVKQDGVPGRLAELWFKAEREGVYFGQCSELCGKDHAYMPITVKVVSQEAYDTWLDSAIAEYGGTPREEDLALAN